MILPQCRCHPFAETHSGSLDNRPTKQRDVCSFDVMEIMWPICAWDKHQCDFAKGTPRGLEKLYWMTSLHYSEILFERTLMFCFMIGISDFNVAVTSFLKIWRKEICSSVWRRLFDESGIWWCYLGLWVQPRSGARNFEFKGVHTKRMLYF